MSDALLSFVEEGNSCFSSTILFSFLFITVSSEVDDALGVCAGSATTIDPESNWKSLAC